MREIEALNLNLNLEDMSDKRTGYEASFVHPLLKRHECPICLFAMRNPVQTECGHLFCRACLERVLSGGRTECPIDKTAISDKMVRLFTYSASFVTLY